MSVLWLTKQMSERTLIERMEGFEEANWASLPVFCTHYNWYLFSMKLNPPLEIGTLASTEDHKSALVEVGNKGFREKNSRCFSE